MTHHTPIRRVANLSAQLNIEWTDWRGRDQECHCDIAYTYDGKDELVIKGWDVLYGTAGDTYAFDEQVYAAVCEVAPEAYAEWQGEYGDEMIARAADAHMIGRAA